MSAPDQSKLPTSPSKGSSGIFTTTRWTMISMANDLDQEVRMSAMEHLCQLYRPAVYTYLKGWGQSREDAEDLTQQFFVQLLTQDTLKHAQSSRGKFRSFLLTCVKNFLHNEHQRKLTQKRGGQYTFETIDDDSEPPTESARPDEEFDRKWAETLIDHALKELEEECVRRNKPFAPLKCYLVESRGQIPMAEKASELGLSEPALKSAVHRLRQRYAAIVKSLVAESIPEGDSVEQELEWLLSTLSR